MTPMMTLEAVAHEARSCRACALAETRTTVVVGSGDPHARVVVVGEAPGANEDRTGEPFVGRSGALLDNLLAEVLDLTRSEVFVVNIVKCRPPENRDPRRTEIDACRHLLVAQIAAVAPDVIVTLGNVATRAVLETKDPITSLRGTRQRSSLSSATVIPTFHPAAALRGGATVRAAMVADLLVVRDLLEGVAQS